MAENSFSHPTRDVQLVRLSAPLDIFGGTRTVHNVVYPANDAQLPGKDIFCLGFGRTRPDVNDSGTLTSAEMTVARVSEKWVEVDRNARRQLPFFDIQYRDYGGTSWTAWSSLGGGIVSAPAAVSPASGHVMVLALDGARRVRYRLRDASGVWSAWATKNGPDASFGSLNEELAALRVAENHVRVYGRTTTGAIVYTSFNLATGNWNVNWFSLGGNFVHGPTVTSSAPGRIDVFAVNQDRTIAYRKWWGYWSESWTNLGGFASYPVDATSRATGSIDLTYRSLGSDLYHRTYAP